jgi:hypothetical protein
MICCPIDFRPLDPPVVWTPYPVIEKDPCPEVPEDVGFAFEIPG